MASPLLPISAVPDHFLTLFFSEGPVSPVQCSSQVQRSPLHLLSQHLFFFLKHAAERLPLLRKEGQRSQVDFTHKLMLNVKQCTYSSGFYKINVAQ